ncbi:BA14K family protein [Nitratireductor sp. ZSWI3]|uniref:BA14K family protein n=1 Tax=Nitratireductor sp. ZSWI3 TaxID=2966359 RepID=UPI00214F66F1|nr:BA14K family protein [Nitratireductor sp. ZSWI3]MCR4269128.1 BA14K family protein [Nitratireductor sp. ZSWI3]
MKRFFKTGMLSLAVAATTLAAISTADAGHRYHRHRDNGDLVAAGVLGLAAGAIVGGLLSSPPSSGRVYIDPPYRPAEPAYYPTYREYRPAYREYRPTYREAYPARPAYYRGSLEPWTRDWYRYCSSRYRSFDPNSGTFMGYDGRRHFCQAN